MFFSHRSVERRAGGVVAGDVPGVELEAQHPSGHREAYDTPVEAAAAPPPRLPPVHPLAVLVETAGMKHGLGVIGAACHGGEEVVAARHRLGTEARAGQIDAPVQ